MNIEEVYTHPGVLNSLDRYLKERVMPGPFLLAVLSNKLKESFQLADDYNAAHLWHLTKHLYWNIPSIAWGSPEAVTKWLDKKDQGNTDT